MDCRFASTGKCRGHLIGSKDGTEVCVGHFDLDRQGEQPRLLRAQELAMVKFADRCRGRGILLAEIPGRAVLCREQQGHDYQGGPAELLFLDVAWRRHEPTSKQNGRLLLRPQPITSRNATWYLYTYDPSWVTRLQAAVLVVEEDYPDVATETSYWGSLLVAAALKEKLGDRDRFVTWRSATVAGDGHTHRIDDWIDMWAFEEPTNRSLPEFLGLSEGDYDDWVERNVGADTLIAECRAEGFGEVDVPKRVKRAPAEKKELTVADLWKIRQPDGVPDDGNG